MRQGKQAMVGKTITSAVLSKDKEELALQFSDGTDMVLQAYGDCCSTSWIESIDIPDNLLGTVQSVEDIDMPDLGNQPDHDVMSYYGLKIVTDRGHAVIDYRNDSNGFYGGDLLVKGEGW
jgi:hypothetical protein